MFVVIPLALARTQPAPEELFRPRGEIATADVEHSSPKFAAAVGDRDGDGSEDFVLVESYPSRVRVHSGRTLEVLREVPIQHACGHDAPRHAEASACAPRSSEAERSRAAHTAAQA